MVAPAKLAKPMNRTTCGNVGCMVATQPVMISTTVSVFNIDVLTGPVINDPEEKIT